MLNFYDYIAKVVLDKKVVANSHLSKDTRCEQKRRDRKVEESARTSFAEMQK